MYGSPTDSILPVNDDLELVVLGRSGDLEGGDTAHSRKVGTRMIFKDSYNLRFFDKQGSYKWWEGGKKYLILGILHGKVNACTIYLLAWRDKKDQWQRKPHRIKALFDINSS